MSGCRSCADKAAKLAVTQSKVMQTRVESNDKPLQPGFVRIRYTGAKMAPVTYYANGHGYQACASQKYRIQDVNEKDAATLLGMACFERVRVAPQVETPKPIEAVKPPEPVKVEPVPIAVAPVVNVVAMQSMVAAMEQADGKPIQPKIEAPKVEAVPQTPVIEVKTVEPKRNTYRGKGKRK